MKSFTMIPDGLTVKGGVARRDLIAYLIRAFGHPGGQRWNDLTIEQMSKFVCLSRRNASRHFNYIVDNWVDEFLPRVEIVDDYRGMDYRGFYQFLLATQRRAKFKVPRHPMCTKAVQDVYQNDTDMCTETIHYKNDRKDVLDEDSTRLPLVSEEESSDSTDKGETERQNPVRSRRDGRRVLLGGGRKDRQVRPTDDDWILSLVEKIEDRDL
jgi:hypothetical protein